MIKGCAICCREFDTAGVNGRRKNHGRRKICSTCLKSPPPVTRRCVVCGNEFAPRDASWNELHRKTCSDFCRWFAHGVSNARAREKYGRWQSVTLSKMLKEQRAHYQRFRSNPDARINAQRGAWRLCIICGMSFMLADSRHRTTCSDQCYAEHHRQLKRQRPSYRRYHRSERGREWHRQWVANHPERVQRYRLNSYERREAQKNFNRLALRTLVDMGIVPEYRQPPGKPRQPKLPKSPKPSKAVPRTCVICGIHFIRRGSGKTCSRACGYALWLERRREYKRSVRAGLSNRVTCVVCGGWFPGHKGALTCSLVCRQALKPTPTPKEPKPSKPRQRYRELSPEAKAKRNARRSELQALRRAAGQTLRELHIDPLAAEEKGNVGD